ncbi:hypothetical protein [Mucilaginibacter ginsenosidivorax]|uniref:Uncharacterized protein n=1 Tax=Mucilaginibacter ginsenosidivorax TaxID=862126 RepID=A0A5B8W236_9SPHI|nr:hypothetical protein [Mucilaginibacter ginsenosidivorax]QEC77821.1 hypothetical protein FSB76_18445 [Mucilaginibacter ginsenosidivorax]
MPNTSQTSSQQVKATFQANRCFVNSSNTVTYLINGSYCFFTNKICSFTYDEVNNIIAINYAGVMSDKKDDMVYYEIESGYDVKDRGYQMGINVSEVERSYNLNGNLSNPCYALVQMDKLSEGRYQLSRSGDRFSFYKPLNINDVLNDFSYAMDGLKQTSSSYSQAFLVTENKMNLIESQGAENIDAVLSNKVDHTYKSLMAKWNQINKGKNTVDDYVATHQQVSNNQEYTPSIFNELIANMERMKELIVENEQFNQTLDTEVIPLLQQN